MTRDELADIAGVTTRQLQRINADLPDDKKLFPPNANDISEKDFIKKWIDYCISTKTETWTKKRLAKLTGYTVQRVGDFEKESEGTFFVPTPDGGYDLSEFVRRWVQYREEKIRDSSDSFDLVRTEHEKVKTRKTELEVKRIEGQLVDADEVEAYWLDIANTIRQGFVQFAAHTAPLVYGLKSQDEIKEVIDKEARRILESLAVNAVPMDEPPEVETGE